MARTKYRWILLTVLFFFIYGFVVGTVNHYVTEPTQSWFLYFDWNYALMFILFAIIARFISNE